MFNDGRYDDRDSTKMTFQKTKYYKSLRRKIIYSKPNSENIDQDQSSMGQFVQLLNNNNFRDSELLPWLKSTPLHINLGSFLSY